MSQIDKEILYNQKFFENILGSMSDLLIVINPDATIRFVNQVTLEVLGYNLEDLEGVSAGELFDNQDLQFFGLVRGLIAGGRVRNKGIYLVSKEGEKIPVVLNGSVIRNDEHKIDGMVWVARDMRDVHQLITELAQANEELEDRVRRRTEELRVAKEASDEAFRELQQTQSRLVQSEKMASIGQLAAGIAHEINNPAGFVTSNLTTLEDYIKDIKSIFISYDSILKRCKEMADAELVSLIKEAEEKKEAIDFSFILNDINGIIQETQEGMRRISKIVKDLREFSHGGSDKPEYADLNKGLESTLNIVWNEIKYKAEVVTLYGDIPQILCYPQQMNQVFMNILVNAAQAIKEKGTIRVRTFTEEGHVVVEISDTGEGIPPENLSRIFDPFFTTKPVGKGTGLGLAIVYAIVRKHGGDIKVESEVGRGSCFKVYMPVENPQFKKDNGG